MLSALMLAAAAAPNVTVEALGETRFRFTTVYADNGDYQVIMRAQLRLTAEARRICRGRGRAVSEGSVRADQAPGRPGRIALSEIYNCIAPAAR
ncbi:MAG TPA: hypothetical protein VEX35_12480 [Allosphingosinicella sp.]|nr:hypothetical protein [Allosphingosinicella sp.]